MSSSVQSLEDPLKRALGDAELGPWSVDPRSIKVIASRLRNRPPSRVLELGSGWSTVCLAALMRELFDADETRVLTIEQDERFASTTRELLRERSLDDQAQVVTAPLMSTGNGYDLSLVVGDLSRHPFEAVLIDGPAGPTGARASTLPKVLPYLTNGAQVFLDDALRDSELSFLADWRSIPGFILEGIVVTGTGLLIGHVET